MSILATGQDRIASLTLIYEEVPEVIKKKSYKHLYYKLSA